MKLNCAARGWGERGGARAFAAAGGGTEGAS
jgi:hypothetical protein